MNENVFICTKPLQYFNIKNIPYSKYFNANDKKILIVADEFYRSEDFYKEIKKVDKDWDKVIFRRNYNHALLYLWSHYSVSNVFLSSDIGLFVSLTCSLRSFNVYTYEEGVDTYSVNRTLTGSSSLLKLFRTCLGNGLYMNDSKWLNGCFLYSPELFVRFRPQTAIRLYKMERSFSEHMYKMRDFFKGLYDDSVISPINDIKKSSVLLYISNWEIDNRIVCEISNVKRHYDYVLIKLHPNIKKKIEILRDNNVIYVNNQMMAEFLITLLLSNENQITIFHNNSTAVLYYQNDVKLVSFSKDENYDKISSFLANKALYL